MRPSRLTVTANEVQVWIAVLDGTFEAVRSTLSRDEVERALRFRFTRDRNRFAVGRSMLRCLLAAYTGTSAEEIRFSYGPYGKPAVLASEMSFNVSHSASLAMFAFSRGLEIGVDVEELDSRPSDREVAEHFFSQTEVETLFGLPPEAQAAAFLTCWTRKEAYIKARGEGLSLPLHDFDVTLAPGVAPALVRTAWSAAEPESWRLFDLTSECPGYIASLAVRARDVTVSVRGKASGLVRLASTVRAASYAEIAAQT